jgi:hypothetical protein
LATETVSERVAEEAFAATVMFTGPFPLPLAVLGSTLRNAEAVEADQPQFAADAVNGSDTCPPPDGTRTNVAGKENEQVTPVWVIE